MTRPGQLEIKIRLYCGDEIAMGPGKADLLDAIEAEGSISGAGRALGMSYRRAWLLVDTMNRCWGERLVETVSGGSHEKGARVSAAGKAVLAAYRALQQGAEAGAAPLLNGSSLTVLMRDAPLTPGTGSRRS